MVLKIFKLFIFALAIFTCSYVYAGSDNMKIFPLDNYSQNVDEWINPVLANYTQSLLDTDYQEQRLTQLKHTYFGTLNNDNSPWSEGHIKYVLNSQTESKNIYNGVKSSLADFDNSHQDTKHISYAMNYRPHTQIWWDKISANTNFTQFQNLNYNKKNRAIAVTNLSLRGLPTEDSAFYSYKIAGEGYPFDNLSISAVYAGTPVYILGSSLDKQWYLLMAPEYIGWVKANGIAMVDDKFINTWQRAAYKNIVGIANSNVSIIEEKSNQYQFSGYVGMIFPLVRHADKFNEIYIPQKLANGMAVVAKARVPVADASVLPLEATPQNFAKLFKVLQGRPYGWGSLEFYTDCSAEMKAIYTMFGFYLPRNTKHQRDAGKTVDISALSRNDRLDYLIKNADPLLTLVRLKGHILMYVGTYKYANGSEVAMTYQQMWGLSPQNRTSRAVIGQSIFLPLLTSFPEDTDLGSQLDNSVFELIYLDQFPDKQLRTGINELMY